MLHCDSRVRWKVASDLRFWAAICEPKTPSFRRFSGDLAPSTRNSHERLRLCDFGALAAKQEKSGKEGQGKTEALHAKLDELIIKVDTGFAALQTCSEAGVPSAQE